MVFVSQGRYVNVGAGYTEWFQLWSEYFHSLAVCVCVCCSPTVYGSSIRGGWGGGVVARLEWVGAGP